MATTRTRTLATSLPSRCLADQYPPTHVLYISLRSAPCLYPGWPPNINYENRGGQTNSIKKFLNSAFATPYYLARCYLFFLRRNIPYHLLNHSTKRYALYLLVFAFWLAVAERFVAFVGGLKRPEPIRGEVGGGPKEKKKRRHPSGAAVGFSSPVDETKIATNRKFLPAISGRFTAHVSRFQRLTIAGYNQTQPAKNQKGSLTRKTQYFSTLLKSKFSHSNS